MQVDIPVVRIILYCILLFFTFVLFCLSAARLNYTNHLPPHDPLNNGRSFSDPVVVEILFTTLITMPWAVFVGYSIHKRYEYKSFTTFLVEIVGLSVLWIFWIAGAATASGPWGNLSFCQQFEACRVLSALVAFAWLGWITITVLLGLSLLFSLANKSLFEPFHGRWNPRQSQYGDNVSRI
ncbi:hypothetical protein JR316_0010424 [Psilocybe cubensis]|uniref:MARVEL domain-containing protein n=2 Tax=Psilocybe cubensis TaxID=181762 RepID=A0A8H7XLW1_PSICU|nr:hypothetical protein JR316_0010424 [Psilocybe cubensis]KAH9476512.1 hypothetical protein JR316_0010424 [Psilocybe cubensis]